MDVYTVDRTFKKTNPVDSYNSIVWTDRYNASGDVTLVVPATDANRSLFVENTFLSITDSKEIMLIDTINIKEGVLTATGNSLVDFFKQRLFRAVWGGDDSAYAISEVTAWGIIYSLVGAFANPGSSLINGTVLTSPQGTNEVIPNLSQPTSPVAGDDISISIPYGNLYDAVKLVADADALGFTLHPPALDGSSALTFYSYRGLDRTTSQSTNQPVLFDPAMDNLTDVEELRSIQKFKNVAWVWPQGITSQSQVGLAFIPGTETLSSWDRRTMLVDATNINVADYPDPGILAVFLAAVGRDALANNNYVRMVDGTIVPQNAYTYGVDYNLGDVVELRGAAGGVSQQARVVEYIHARDATGEQAYPTLSIVS